MAIAFQVTVNPDNNKFKVKRVNTGMGARDGDGVFYVVVPEDMDKLPPGVALGAYNKTHSTQIKKFTSISQARDEGYEALRSMANAKEENQEAPVAEVAEKPKRSRKKKEGEASEPRGPRLTQIAPKPLGEQKAARAGSKIAAMIDLLSNGITAEDLKAKLERKGRALSGRIHRIHGYGVHSETRDGKTFYTLVLPEGMNAPLPHVVPESKPVKKAEATEGAEGGEAKPKRTRKPKAEAEQPAEAAAASE